MSSLGKTFFLKKMIDLCWTWTSAGIHHWDPLHIRPKGNMCKQEKGWRTNKQTKLPEFRKQPSYDGGLPLCQVWGKKKILKKFSFAGLEPALAYIIEIHYTLGHKGICPNRKRADGQTNRRNCLNFESNLAMMVVYVRYVKFQFDWSNGFRVRGRKPKPDGRTDRTDAGRGRRTHQSNRRVGYTQPAQKTPSVCKHPVNFIKT